MRQARPGARADAPRAEASGNGRLTVALVAGPDRFEDFYDKIGVSIDDFRTRLSSGWIVNYVDALTSAGVRTVLVFLSSRVSDHRRFIHGGTGMPVWILKEPHRHRYLLKVRGRWPTSSVPPALVSYASTPIRALIKTLDRERCDAILCQEYESTRLDLCVLTKRLHGRPVFATYQGANRTASRIEEPIRRYTVRHGDGLIIAAQSERERVTSKYGIPRERIADIPNPVDVDGWAPIERSVARARLGITDDAAVVEWHGHAQVWRKGLDVLLDAWEIVCAERADRDLLLLIVGQGRNTAELRRRVEGNPRIRWIDRFIHDREELKTYLCAADVYTLPSRHEGFAVAPLEAMACGLPVVASDASGVADLLPHGEASGGVVVPPGDATALASALARLLDDPVRAQDLGARAKRRLKREFSLDVVGRRLRVLMFPKQLVSRTDGG
jgi:glycosyltransferase involved in cell wall biosynthesis